MILENSNILLENNTIIEPLGILSIPGIIIWWDANTFNQPDGTRIPNVIDRAGSGFNLLQGDITRQPRIKTNAINSNNAIEFDVFSGNPTLMATRQGLNNFFNGKIVEVFTVFKFVTTPSNNQIWHFRSSTNPVLRLNTNGASRLQLFTSSDSGNTTTNTITTTLTNNQFYIAYIRVDLTSGITTTLEIDNIGSNTVSDVNTYTFSNHTFRLSASNNPVVNEIGETILFSNNTSLLSSEKLSVITSLKSKYNL